MPKSMGQPRSIPRWPNRRQEERIKPDLFLRFWLLPAPRRPHLAKTTLLWNFLRVKQHLFGISFMFCSSSTPKPLGWPACMRRRCRSTNAPGVCSRLPSKTTTALSRPRVRPSSGENRLSRDGWTTEHTALYNFCVLSQERQRSQWKWEKFSDLTFKI